jgi:D-cysteine desulfhydrase
MRAPRRIALARLPTPLQPLDRLSAELGGPRIWVKRDDLSESGAGGNKVRKLEFVLAEALHQGADTLITCGGLQSNHCRATALVGARLGLSVELVLRGTPSALPDGNLFLDHLAGASLHTYPARIYQTELPALLEAHASRLRSLGRRPFVIPTGASDGLGVWGYLSASEELAVDFRAAGIRPRHLVVATGSGGTQAGLCAGLHLHVPDCQVHGVAVCDDAAWFRAKVRADLSDWRVRSGCTLDLDAIHISTLDAYIGPGYGVADEATLSTIRRLARIEGLLLDPVYTGKAFHGLLQELAAGRLREGNDIVFVHTGGIFGLFPQREQVLRGAGQPGSRDDAGMRH